MCALWCVQALSWSVPYPYFAAPEGRLNAPKTYGTLAQLVWKAYRQGTMEVRFGSLLTKALECSQREPPWNGTAWYGTVWFSSKSAWMLTKRTTPEQHGMVRYGVVLFKKRLNTFLDRVRLWNIHNNIQKWTLTTWKVSIQHDNTVRPRLSGHVEKWFGLMWESC